MIRKISMNMSSEVWITSLISFVNALCFSSVIPIIFEYSSEFGLNALQISMLFSAFAVAQFIANPIIGKLSDIYGRKPLLVISLAGTVLSNLFAFLAPTAALLFFARILDGITGGNNSVAQSVISDATKPEQRPKAFGMFGAAYGLAFVVGPLISVGLQQFSLAAPFLGSAFFALIAVFVTIFLLPETNKPETVEDVREMNYTRIFGSIFDSCINAFLLLTLISTTAFGVFQLGSQPYALNVLQIGSEGIGLVLFIFGIFAAFGQIVLIPYLIKTIGYARTQLLSLLVCATCFFLLPINGSGVVFVLLTPIFASFFFAFRQIASSLITINTRKQDHGIVLGLLESYFGLGTAIGPLIGGAIITWHSEYSDVLMGFGAMMPEKFSFYTGAAILGLAMILVINRRAEFRENPNTIKII